MNEIAKGLYQFSTYIPPMDFTIHQYLLASDPAILWRGLSSRRRRYCRTSRGSWAAGP